MMHTIAIGVHHPYTYGVGSLAYAPRYYANSGGAVHIVKRDAEAEPAADADADAALYGYSYGGYHPYAYSAYRHPFAYSGYRYPFYHHYGKRSAEAEPYRGYYGYGGYYGYSRPHYGYGYYRG